MKRIKTSNPVAKNARKYNKAAVMIDRKREMKKRGYELKGDCDENI